jgi:GTP cyclohydrolase I/GTP cyclohydrolase-4
MTACPCAQELLIDRARARLDEQGFDSGEIERVLEAVPVATHNQRGIGTLHIGCPETCGSDIEAQTLLRIVEESMSSEIYELMKRPDELEVVEKAHRRPRFVEDCVREMIRMAVDEFRGFGEDAFVFARQENLETIHQHNVVAERYGVIGELDRELRTHEPAAGHVTMGDWLHGS